MADDEDKREITPSELDESTHREVGLIYEDATRTILYAKSIQWKAVASSLVMFFVVIALVRYVSNQEDYVKILKLGVLFTGMAAISLLIIFQFWQHTELQKIVAVEKLYSSAFRAIRKKKSKLEANVHRFIILSIMIGAILLGGFVTVTSLDKVKTPVTNQFQYKP